MRVEYCRRTSCATFLSVPACSVKKMGIVQLMGLRAKRFVHGMEAFCIIIPGDGDMVANWMVR